MSLSESTNVFIICPKLCMAPPNPSAWVCMYLMKIVMPEQSFSFVAGVVALMK